MSTQVLELESILVDPREFSPRARWFDDVALLDCVERINANEPLPLLRVAPIADPSAPCWNMGTKPAEAQWNRRQRTADLCLDGTTWGWRPALPQWVLFDGFVRLAALYKTGARRVEVEVVDQAVNLPREVWLLGHLANKAPQRRLLDTDKRHNFELLYLGRQPSSDGETWAQGKDGLSTGQIAEKLGYKAAWGSQMLAYCRFSYAVGAELGLAKSYSLSRAPREMWVDLIWCEGQLRVHEVKTDGKWGHKTIAQMTLAEVDRLVAGVVERGQLPGKLAAARPALRDADKPEPKVTDFVQMTWDFGYADAVMSKVREIKPHIKRLDNDSLIAVYAQASAPSLELHEVAHEAELELRRRGIDPSAALASAAAVA